MFVVDDDDPMRDAYHDVVMASGSTAEVYDVPEGVANGGMVGPLNYVIAREMSNLTHHEFIGFMGDDHRPRSLRWDNTLMHAMVDHNALIGYGDDLVQRAALPTSVLMRVSVVRALGYMAPPCLRHLYVDNYWRDLGKAVGRLHYTARVVIAHEHPITGKVEWDEGYRRVNDGLMYSQDHAAYWEFIAQGGIEADAAKIRNL